MQHQAQIDAARQGDGYNYNDCFRHVKKEISEADMAIGNLEVTLGGKPYRGYPAFSAPDEYLYAIKEAGFDVLLTANNHCLDKGKLGLERTILMLDSLKIHHAGTYRNPEERHRNYPLLIEKNGFRIVLLNYTYGTNGFKTDAPNMVNYINREQIKKDILDARRKLPDVIIACIGENSYCETPGNLTDLNLSTNQKDLVKALAATGKPIILVLNEGRPRIIHDIVPLAKAIVHIMLPGNYGADALVNLVSGKANFSGKLPFTYPHLINSLATYDYKPCENMGQMGGNYNYDAVMDVQWPFGFGLSYTTYSYSNLKVNRTSFDADNELVFTVDVTNTGKMAGKESVLLYSRDLVASITPDNIRLRNFEKVDLQPGETKTVIMKLKGSDLAFVSADGKWRLEKGAFRMTCGTQKLEVHCTTTKIWQTPNISKSGI